MNLEDFKKLPDNARVWIYAFENALSAEDKPAVVDRIGSFMKQWRSHKVGVEGTFTVIHDRFAILSGASRDGISGCSIDSSVENFKYLRDRLGLDALNRDLVHYRDRDGVVRSLDRAAFQREVDGGRCGPETVVFDTTIQTLGELRAGRFEVRLADSWHGKVFLSSKQAR